MNLILNYSTLYYTVLYSLFICTLWVIHKILSFYKRRSLYNPIPVAGMHPLYGTSKTFGPDEDGLRRRLKVMAENPQHKLWRTRFGPFVDGVLLVHPDTIGQVLSMSATDMPKFSFVYNVFTPVIGEGLLIANNPKWSTRRKMLTPAFHFDIINGYIEIFNDSISTLMAYWDKLLLDDSASIDINVFQCMSKLTLDVMLRCACSYELASPINNVDFENDYLSAIKSSNRLIIEQLFNIIYYFKPIFYLSKDGAEWRKCCRIIRDQSLKVIKARRQELLTESTTRSHEIKKRKDFIDILLTATDSDGKHLTDQDIIDEMNTFLFEGHDTTASGLAWTLYMLGIHSNYQNQCRDEIRQVLSGRDSEAIQYNDVTELKFTTMCIKETMRLYPPVVASFRTNTKDTTIDGYFIPKDSMIIIGIIECHYNREFWANPDTFDPLRFKDPIPGGHPYAFISFSAGARNCIGQKFAITELVIAVARIINNFEIKSVPKEIRRSIKVILRNESELVIKLKRI